MEMNKMYKQYLMTGVITDSVFVFGEECWLIPAIPIKFVEEWNSVRRCVLPDAIEYFLFSAETEIVGVELWANIDANQPLWTPVQEDFIHSQVVYESRTIEVWQHVSMIEETLQEEKDAFLCPWNSDRWNLDYPNRTLIRGFVMKRNIIWRTYTKKEQREDFIQDFIVERTKMNKNFFVWLFDDVALSDVPIERLDDAHRKDWLLFLHSFDL